MNTLDNDNTAAWSFYRKVREWALRLKPWQDAIWHEILPDEEYNLPLVSYRIYERMDEVLVVMACAGINSVDETLKHGQRLAFPSEQQLHAFKRQAGFESRAEYRDSGEPVWL